MADSKIERIERHSTCTKTTQQLTQQLRRFPFLRTRNATRFFVALSPEHTLARALDLHVHRRVDSRVSTRRITSRRGENRRFSRRSVHLRIARGSPERADSFIDFPRGIPFKTSSRCERRNIIAALNSGPIRAPPSSTSIKLHRLAVMLTSHPSRTECYWC